MTKFYAINRFNLTGVLAVGSGMFGHPTAEEAEQCARLTAENYGDQTFVRVVQASNYNEAIALGAGK